MNLLDNPKELFELIHVSLKPKHKEKREYSEVFTPMDFINNKMLKDIEEYWLQNKNENIWTNEKITWYDPATGMGNYQIAIYYKLMEGLKNKIPNEEERKKHIIETQIYMGEINKNNCILVEKIFNANNKYKLNLYEGDTLNINLYDIFKKTNFDIIIGNPPYNGVQTKYKSTTLYDKFIDYYIDKCSLISFIIPSRWFSSCKRLDKFRNMMINRTDILYIKHIDNASDIFGKTLEINGGVNYFLIDKNYNGLCDYNGTKTKINTYDIMVDNKYYDIVNKILDKEKITNILNKKSHYDIETNYKRLINENKQDYIKCYVSQQKGFIKYIHKNDIKKEYNTYKVLTPAINGNKCKKNKKFGNIFMCSPNEVYTKTYISFNVKSEDEAHSLISYMKCKLPNLLLSLRKTSLGITEKTLEWIPLPPLNKHWNDDEVYKYFELSKDDIKIINN
jgi:hypothetical protein